MVHDFINKFYKNMGWYQKSILEKYKYNCIHHDLRNQVFKMNQKEDEILEDLVDIFTYNVKISKLHNLGSDTLETLLLNAMKDEWIDLLNLVGKRYVSKLSFPEICEMCKNISRGKSKYRRSCQDPIMTRVDRKSVV